MQVVLAKQYSLEGISTRRQLYIRVVRIYLLQPEGGSNEVSWRRLKLKVSCHEQ